MASGTSIWSTYGLGWPASINSAATNSGNAENLSDMLPVIIDPTDVPVYTMLQKEALDAVYMEWLTDSLAATATTPASEGGDWSPTALSGRTRYSNVTQIFLTGFYVSRSQLKQSQRGKTAGVRNEYQYQLEKKLKECLRNVDARIVANGTAVASASGTTAVDRRMAAIRAFPIVVTQVSGVFATASFANLRETMDGTGANPDTLFVSSGVKADISNLILAPGATATNTSLRRFVADASDKQFGGVIDFVLDDFGRIMIVRDRWIPQATATASVTADTAAYFLLDRSMVRLCVFDAPQHVPLPPNGDHQRGFVVTELSLKVAHPSSVGIGYNLIT